MLQTLFTISCIIYAYINPRVTSSDSDGQCTWKKSANSPNVYWINMDKSIDRRVAMEKHLNDFVGPEKHFRVRGFTLSDIYIPSDVEKHWQSYEAKYNTSEEIPQKSLVTETSKFWQYKVIVSSLFGRRKHNQIKEIGCTISHLYAMRQAINDINSRSPYALIIEDDVQFLFNVDWDALVATGELVVALHGKYSVITSHHRSTILLYNVAPSNWGIIQLFNSNKDTLEQRWGDYQKRKGLWVEKWPRQPVAYWSTCAYLINKAVMKPIVHEVLQVRNGWDDVKLIAGVMSPAIPRNSKCAKNVSGTITYSMEPPCIWSPKGFQADAYLYSMTKTWVLNVPLIANGAGGNESTFHQDHVVSIHQGAFQSLRGILNNMLSGAVTLPPFVTQACKGKELAVMVLNNVTVPSL